MILSSITIADATNLRVRRFDPTLMAFVGARWMRLLAPDLSGRLTVDPEDGGPKVTLDVTRGPGFGASTQRILQSFPDAHAAASELVTLRDPLSGRRLTSSLVLSEMPMGPATQDQLLPLAALFANAPGGRSLQSSFPGIAKVILDARPCIVTLHLPPDGEPARLVGAAEDVALCLAAATLTRGPDSDAPAGPRGQRRASDRLRIGRKWARKGRRWRAA